MIKIGPEKLMQLVVLTNKKTPEICNASLGMVGVIIAMRAGASVLEKLTQQIGASLPSSVS